MSHIANILESFYTYPVPPTRAAEIASVGDDPHPAVEIIAGKMGASERADWRIAATIDAALGVFSPSDEVRAAACAALRGEQYDRDVLRPVVTLLHVDLGGIGGTGGYKGGATDRMRVFSRLGAGRWQARDGGAWEAAAKNALECLGYPHESLRLDPLDIIKVIDVVDPIDRGWLVAECLRQIEAELSRTDGPRQHDEWAKVLDRVVGYWWGDAAIAVRDALGENAPGVADIEANAGQPGYPTMEQLERHIPDCFGVRLAVRYGVDPACAAHRVREAERAGEFRREAPQETAAEPEPADECRIEIVNRRQELVAEASSAT